MGNSGSVCASHRETFPTGSVQSPVLFEYRDYHGCKYEYTVMVEPAGHIWLLWTSYHKWGAHFRTTNIGMITDVYKADNGDLNIITSIVKSLGNDKWNEQKLVSFSKVHDGRIVGHGGHICSQLKTHFYNTDSVFTDKPFVKALDDFFVVSQVGSNHA